MGDDSITCHNLCICQKNVPSAIDDLTSPKEFANIMIKFNFTKEQTYDYIAGGYGFEGYLGRYAMWRVDVPFAQELKFDVYKFDQNRFQNRLK